MAHLFYASQYEEEKRVTTSLLADRAYDSTLSVSTASRIFLQDRQLVLFLINAERNRWKKWLVRLLA